MNRVCAVAVAANLLVLASCGAPMADDGFLDRSAVDMAKVAFDDMQDVSSLRLLGRARTELGLTDVDVRADVDGNCVGSFRPDTGSVQFVRTDDGAWLKPDEDYWRAEAESTRLADELVRRFNGSWIALDDESGFEAMCDLKELLASFKLDKGDTAGRISKGEVEMIGETDAIPLHGRDGKQRSTIWVSVESPHHVVKMAPTDADGGTDEALYFEEFGVEVVAEPPAKADIAEVPRP